MRVVAIIGWGRGQRETIVDGITMAAIAVGPKVFGLFCCRSVTGLARRAPDVAMYLHLDLLLLLTNNFLPRNPCTMLVFTLGAFACEDLTPGFFNLEVWVSTAFGKYCRPFVCTFTPFVAFLLDTEELLKILPFLSNFFILWSRRTTAPDGFLVCPL